MIYFDGQILLISGVRNKDIWGLPGGGIEPGELPCNAAVRETFEEVIFISLFSCYCFLRLRCLCTILCIFFCLCIFSYS